MAFLSLLCQASHVPIFMLPLSLAGLENQMMELKIITFKKIKMKVLILLHTYFTHQTITLLHLAFSLITWCDFFNVLEK